ncbi:MAG TPA: serine protease [Stellaceae bacterium]|nr:serine protease [Stellaceae bacterium]
MAAAISRWIAALLLPLVASLATAAAAGPAADGDGAAAGRVKSGTGFFVSRDGFLVTGAHVVSGCRDLSVWASDGSERRSYVIAADPRLDVALLWADGRRLGQSAVASHGPPRTGEEVFTLGFGVFATTPLRPLLVEGSLMGDSTALPGNRVLMIRARLHAGNSGGAVLAGDGSLVGMIIGRDEAHPDLGVALPSADIEALLSTYGIVLPQRDPTGNARDFLGAISALIQCSPTGGRVASPRGARLGERPMQ